MSTARDDILTRIREALGRSEAASGSNAEVDRRLAGPPAHPRPPLPGDPVQSFESALNAVQGGFTRTASDRVMESIAACLDARDLDRTLVAAPALQDLPWPEDWTVTFGPSRGDDRVSVTPCFAAVAETGSVVMVSGPDTPTSLNFLPDFHVVLVHADQLVHHVEDVWAKLRAAGAPPRAVNFVTGPSKTADVEQTIQYGAHGPRSLDVLFID